MRHTLTVPIMILIILAILSGCIFKPEEKLLPENWNKNNITVRYMENRDTIITKDDFPDFKLTNHLYFVSLKNASLTLETEGSHQSGSANASDINTSEEMPADYRLYGGSESYSSNDRYILLQYKVFDKDDKLNDSINMTAYDYIRKGFNYATLDNASYKGRIFLLQSNVTNRTDMNVTNRTDINVTVILFGYDTVIGKIGVQDSKDKSLNESLKILNIVHDRLKIGVDNVTIAKTDFGTHGQLSNQSGD